MEISHEEFITSLKENDKYEKMKDNLRSKNENYEIEQYKVKDLSGRNYCVYYEQCLSVMKLLIIHVSIKWNHID